MDVKDRSNESRVFEGARWGWGEGKGVNGMNPSCWAEQNESLIKAV